MLSKRFSHTKDVWRYGRIKTGASPKFTYIIRLYAFIRAAPKSGYCSKTWIEKFRSSPSQARLSEFNRNENVTEPTCASLVSVSELEKGQNG